MPRESSVLRAALAPAAVLAAYLGGWAACGECVRWPPLNAALHLAGGVAVAHLAAALLAPLAPGLPRRAGALLLAAGCLALTTTVAVSWEFLECLVARLLGVRGPSGSADTLLDIALGMVGASAYALRYGVGARRAHGADGLQEPSGDLAGSGQARASP